MKGKGKLTEAEEAFRREYDKTGDGKRKTVDDEDDDDGDDEYGEEFEDEGEQNEHHAELEAALSVLVKLERFALANAAVEPPPDSSPPKSKLASTLHGAVSKLLTIKKQVLGRARKRSRCASPRGESKEFERCRRQWQQ